MKERRFGTESATLASGCHWAMVRDLGRRFAQQVARIAGFVIALIATVTVAHADCVSARADEKAKLDEYLAKDLQYEVAKFTIGWIHKARKKYEAPEALAAKRENAHRVKSQLELEVQQAQTAYDAAHSLAESECSSDE